MAEPVVVSIMEFPGDPEQLREQMKGIDEVASRKATEYGGVSSTVVRTDNGIMIINMWDSEDGRHRMGDDPEIRQAAQDAGLPPPSAKGYEVLQHRSPERASAGRGVASAGAGKTRAVAEAAADNRERPVAGPRAAWRLVRRRDFGPYFLGNALSASGTWFQNLAAALLIYRLTHSALLLGVLNFSQFIPILVLTPWAGAVADRVDRRRLLLVFQTIAVGLAAGLALLAWAGLATTWVVIGDALCLGVVSAFSAPAQQALIVSLVRPDEVPTAVALNSMTFNLARALGPVGAALTVHYLGIPASFAVNAASFGIFVAALLVVRPRPQEKAPRDESRMRESFRVLVRRPELAAFLVIVAVVGFASDPVNTLSPAFAHAFGYPDTVAGFIVGVFGAGAVTAALVVAGRVAGSRWRMALTLFMLGAGVAAFSLCPWLPLGFVLLFGAGFGYLASNTSATTRLQLGVEEWQRGRMMALWSVAFLGLRPFASLLDGAIAHAWSVRAAGVVLAMPALVAAAAVAVSALVSGRGGASSRRGRSRSDTSRARA
jgi:MFS family permease